MTDTGTSPNGGSIDAPEPIVEKGRGISLIWVIPIVAVIVGASIAIDAYRNRGTEIVITLPSAEWIEAGKTKIRYLNIEIGSVDEIKVNEKVDGVDLHCTLHPGVHKYLTEGAQFWLVYPRVGAGGISGLGTLVSGAYVTMHPGPVTAKEKRLFAGLTTPPLESDFSPGLTIRLKADQLYSLDVGSPVYYREIKVGVIEQHTLLKDGSGVEMSLFFKPEYAGLVREDSRFWNAGGIAITGHIPNLELHTESVAAFLSGGIAFDSPLGEKAKPADKSSEFWLHPTRSDVDSYPFTYGGLRVYLEGSKLGSIEVGDSVFYREIMVGAVISRELTNDSRRIRVGINVQPRYAPLVRSNSVFWNASGISASLGLHGLEVHTESLKSIVSGGVAFATPDPPGDRVKAGSVFAMKDEVKDEWLKWSPLIWRGPASAAPPAAAPKESKSQAASESESENERGAASRVESFFHHEKKSEDEAAKAGEPEKDASQESAKDAHRHSFFMGHRRGMNRN